MPHCVLTRYHMLYPLDTPLLYVSLLCVLNNPRSLKYPHYAPSIFLIYSYSWWCLEYIVLFMHNQFFWWENDMSPHTGIWLSYWQFLWLSSVEAEGIYLREHVERLEADGSSNSVTWKAKNTWRFPAIPLDVWFFLRKIVIYTRSYKLFAGELGIN